MINDCICCAERKLLDRVKREGMKKGVKVHQMPSWIHRRYGDFKIVRDRKDGVIGISIPCVICRKALERARVQWTAFDGTRWVHSLQTADLPPSKPTSKQKRHLGFDHNPERPF